MSVAVEWIRERNEAREAGDYELADFLRDKLEEQGWHVHDGPVPEGRYGYGGIPTAGLLLIPVPDGRVLQETMVTGGSWAVRFSRLEPHDGSGTWYRAVFQGVV